MKLLLCAFGILVFSIVIILYCCLRAGAEADEHMDDLVKKS